MQKCHVSFMLSIGRSVGFEVNILDSEKHTDLLRFSFALTELSSPTDDDLCFIGDL